MSWQDELSASAPVCPADAPSLLEVQGTRVIEVTQTLRGELVALAQLEDRPRWVCRALSASGLLLLAGGLTSLVVAPGFGGVLLGLATALVVAARALRPGPEVINVATGRPLLRRGRGWTVEVLLPREARSTLVSPSGFTPLGGPGEASETASSCVPMPPDGGLQLVHGELVIRLDWTRRPRRPPPLPREPGGGRWPAVLAVSAAVHLVAMMLAAAVPPESFPFDLDLFQRDPPTRRVVISVRNPSRLRGKHLGSIGTRTHGWFPVEPRQDIHLDGFPVLAESCDRPAPRALVYAGHVRARGSRSRRDLQRQLGGRARLLTGCYQRALAACAGAGRLVLRLVIEESGVSAEVDRELTHWDSSFEPWSDDVHVRLERCVIEEVSRWQLAGTRGTTGAWLPLILRYPGARLRWPAQDRGPG